MTGVVGNTEANVAHSPTKNDETTGYISFQLARINEQQVISRTRTRDEPLTSAHP